MSRRNAPNSVSGVSAPAACPATVLSYSRYARPIVLKVCVSAWVAAPPGVTFPLASSWQMAPWKMWTLSAIGLPTRLGMTCAPKRSVGRLAVRAAMGSLCLSCPQLQPGNEGLRGGWGGGGSAAVAVADQLGVLPRLLVGLELGQLLGRGVGHLAALPLLEGQRGRGRLRVDRLRADDVEHHRGMLEELVQLLVAAAAVETLQRRSQLAFLAAELQQPLALALLLARRELLQLLVVLVVSLRLLGDRHQTRRLLLRVRGAGERHQVDLAVVVGGAAAVGALLLRRRGLLRRGHVVALVTV